MVATCAFRHDPFDFLDRRKRRKTRRRICSFGDSRPISTMDLHSPDELLYSLFNVPWILDKRDLCFQCFATRIYAIRISVCNELRACLLNVRDIVKKEHSFKKIFNSRCMKRKFQFSFKIAIQISFIYHLPSFLEEIYADGWSIERRANFLASKTTREAQRRLFLLLRARIINDWLPHQLFALFFSIFSHGKEFSNFLNGNKQFHRNSNHSKLK